MKSIDDMLRQGAQAERVEPPFGLDQRIMADIEARTRRQAPVRRRRSSFAAALAGFVLLVGGASFVILNPAPPIPTGPAVEPSSPQVASLGAVSEQVLDWIGDLRRGEEVRREANLMVGDTERIANALLARMPIHPKGERWTVELNLGLDEPAPEPTSNEPG
jgi:hypothetical protein